MVQAITETVGSILGSLGSQRKPERARPEIPSAVPAILAAPDLKRARMAARAAKDERLINLIAQPEILGILITLGGILASNKIPFSSDEKTNNLLQGISTTATVAVGMGYAGVGDLTALSVAIAAGGASLVDELVTETGSALNPFNWKWPLGPIWNW